jgi:two-component system invasion response regulator UvrY
VSNNVAPQNLLLAIHAVNLGEAPADPHADMQSEDPELQKELDRIASLTLRELELFRLLALGKTVSFCAKAMNLNEKTVYNRQTKIREKLQVDTLAGMVHLAQRHQIIDSNVQI